MRTNPVPVEVRSRFGEGHWSAGFEVAEVVREPDRDLYRIRRRSDGAVLPVLFSSDEIRSDQPLPR